jgi:hypothetical protein
MTWVGLRVHPADDDPGSFRGRQPVSQLGV